MERNLNLTAEVETTDGKLSMEVDSEVVWIGRRYPAEKLTSLMFSRAEWDAIAAEVARYERLAKEMEAAT